MIGCSIAGGTFYNPVSRQFPPNFTGSYFFADYCGGWIRRLDPNRTNTVSTFVTGLAQPVDLKVGVDGTLYYLTRARAGGGAGTLGAVQFTNTPPRFVKGPDQVVLEDAGPQTVPNWATNISAGPPPESWQTLRFVVTPDHPELFALAPGISPTGTLTYTPASNANGVSLVTVLLQDDGGTVKGSRDTSPPQSFQIAITPVNDPPVADASATPGRVVSPNNVNARVALDGSRSSDIENDPLQFLWFADGSPLALTNGRVTVATLSVGTHDLLLRVDDGSDISSSHVTVQIITAATAVSELTVSVQKLNVSKLAEALSRLGAAKKAFEDGAFASGVKQLQSFQKSIRGLVVSKVLEPAVADRLILAAQQLIEVIGQGKDANPKFVSCKCDPDGVIRMEFSGAVGLQWLVQSSEDLQRWETIGLAAEGAAGTFTYVETAGALCRFYRAVLP